MKLKDERYEEIKQTVADLLEDYDVKELPIDLFGLAKKMKVNITLSSELLKKHPKKISEYKLMHYPNSFLIYNPTDQQYVIYIDDLGTREKRQRFSLAHELMHIILNHQEQSERNEKEANFGASYLLAPTSLVLIQASNENLLDVNVIAQIFDVSIPEAGVIVRYNKNRLSLASLSERDYEITINGLLRDSLIEKLRVFR